MTLSMSKEQINESRHEVVKRGFEIIMEKFGRKIEIEDGAFKDILVADAIADVANVQFNKNGLPFKATVTKLVPEPYVMIDIEELSADEEAYMRVTNATYRHAVDKASYDRNVAQ